MRVLKGVQYLVIWPHCQPGFPTEMGALLTLAYPSPEAGPEEDWTALEAERQPAMTMFA